MNGNTQLKESPPASASLCSKSLEVYIPILAGGGRYLPWLGVTTLARVGGTQLGQGVPTLARGCLPWLGVPTLATGIPPWPGGYPPWLGWGTSRCEQTENITFPHPSDAGGKNYRNAEKTT